MSIPLSQEESANQLRVPTLYIFEIPSMLLLFHLIFKYIMNLLLTFYSKNKHKIILDILFTLIN